MPSNIISSQSAPNYYVTYSVMNTEAGANILGHAFLLLSMQQDNNAPIQVINSFGYYSQPSSTTNPLIKAAKTLVGLNVDLQGGHGELKQEAMRYLDKNGLQAINFQVSKNTFDTVLNCCIEETRKEQEAIQELNQQLKDKGKKQNGQTRLSAENVLADKEQRKPRLKKFHIALQLGLNGPDSSQSYSCKDRALDILANNNVINKETRDLIACSKAKQTFPRFSGIALSPIRLISQGKLSPPYKSKRTGKVHFCSDWNKNTLFWATPVRSYPSAPNQNELKADRVTYQVLKDILNRTLRIEDSLYKKIYKLEQDPSRDNHSNVLKNQLNNIERLREIFKNASNNKNQNFLQDNILKAKTILNIATLSLTPEKANYSFLFRAIQSVYMHHTMLGLLTLAITITTIGLTPLSATISSGALLHAGRNLYGFYNEEKDFSKMKSDYIDSTAIESNNGDCLASAI